MSHTNESLYNIDLNEVSAEKKKSSLKRRVAAGLLAVVAIPSGLAACGNGVDQVQAKPVATSATLNPNKAPDIKSTTSPTKGTEYYSQVVEKSNVMDVGQFELLPRDERLPFAQYLIDQSVQRGIYDQVYGPGKQNAEYAHTFTKVSADNTGQEILDNDIFKLQIAYMQFVEGEAKPYDAVEGQKVLSAIYWDVSGKVLMNDYNGTKQQEQTFRSVTPLADKYTAVSTTELQNFTDINGQVVPSKIITFSDNNNKIKYERFVYHVNKSYNGEDRGDWYKENITDTLAGLNQ